MESGDAPPPVRGLLPRLRAHAPFLLVLLVGALVLALSAWFQWVNLDEGAYLDAATSIVHGGVPFVTFDGREPGLLYYLAVGVAVFGPSLFVARLQMVLLDLLAAVAVYLLGRDLHSEGAGLAAAALLLFVPYDIYALPIVALEPAAATPLAWAAYLLLRRRAPDPVYAAGAVGLLLAAAELLRRDSLILAPLALLALIVRLPTVRARVQGTVALIGGFAALFGGVMAYFTLRTSLAWMWEEYGLGAAYTDNTVPYVVHQGVLGFVLVYTPILVVPALLAGVGAVFLRAGPRFGLVAALLSGLLLAWLLTPGTPDLLWGQGELGTTESTWVAVFAMVLLVLGVVELLLSRDPGPGTSRLALLYLGGWVVVFLGFYTFVYPNFFTSYFASVVVPLALLGGIWLADRLGARARAALAPVVAPGPRGPTSPSPSLRAHLQGRQASVLFLVGIVGCLVAGGILSAVVVLGPSNAWNEPAAYSLPSVNQLERTVPLTEVDEVAAYLDTHTPANATLFSGDDLYLVAAHRSNLLDLSLVLDHLVYNSFPVGQDAYPFDPDHLAPSTSMILNAWNHTFVPLFVEGVRTLAWELSAPALGEELRERYHLVASFGNGFDETGVRIWALGPAVVAPATLSQELPPGGDPSSVAVSPSNGTWVEGGLSSPDLLASSPAGGAPWSVSLPSWVGGTRSLAFGPPATTLWVATTGSSVVAFNFSGPGAPRFDGAYPVGGSPDALAFDPLTDRVYAASSIWSNVTMLNASTGAKLLTFPVASDPFSLVLDAATSTLYEGSAGADDLALYNASTGAALSSVPLGFPPDDLLLTADSVIATRYAPGLVVAIDLNNGTQAWADNVPNGAEGLASWGNTLAVSSFVDGSVTLVDLSGGYAEGAWYTGGCASSLAASPTGSLLYGAGPCAAPPMAWRMDASFLSSILAPSGTEVDLDGIPIPSTPWPVYPSVFTVWVFAPGDVPMETLEVLSGPGSWQPLVGVALSAVKGVQNEFTDTTVGAGAGAFLVGVYAPITWTTPFQRRPPDLHHRRWRGLGGPRSLGPGDPGRDPHAR